MSTLLQHIPSPLLAQITRGRCVPVIGAGFSRNAIVPQGETMPLAADLAASLAIDLQDFESNGTLEVFSAYERQYSRVALVEALTRQLLVGVALPGPTHKAFCDLPFDLVVTTNFDFLLEDGYSSLRKYCHPIVNEDQLAVDAVAPRVDLLKLHGDLHRPERLVVTEEDYDAFCGTISVTCDLSCESLYSKDSIIHRVQFG